MASVMKKTGIITKILCLAMMCLFITASSVEGAQADICSPAEAPHPAAEAQQVSNEAQCVSSMLMTGKENTICIQTDTKEEAAEVFFNSVSMDIDRKKLSETYGFYGDYLREGLLETYEMMPSRWDGNDGCWKTELNAVYRLTPKETEYVNRKTDIIADKYGRYTDVTAAMLIARWLAKNLKYEESGNCSTYSALTDGRARCPQYASLFYLIGKKAGLDVRIVRGSYKGSKGERNEYHEWCVMKANGKWYHVDPTAYDAHKNPKWILFGDDTLGKYYEFEDGYLAGLNGSLEREDCAKNKLLVLLPVVEKK